MKETSFEKSLEKLEKIVEELETGELPLEAALKKYEEGIKLAGSCQERLDKAKAKVELLIKKDDGKFAKEPFKTSDKDEA